MASKKTALLRIKGSGLPVHACRWDQEERMTAAEALDHPYLSKAANLTATFAQKTHLPFLKVHI